MNSACNDLQAYPVIMPQILHADQLQVSVSTLRTFMCESFMADNLTPAKAAEIVIAVLKFSLIPHTPVVKEIENSRTSWQSRVMLGTSDVRAAASATQNLHLDTNYPVGRKTYGSQIRTQVARYGRRMRHLGRPRNLLQIQPSQS